MSPDKYTGKQVAKAGKAILDIENLHKNKKQFGEVMDVISFWRLCHEEPLDKAWEILQKTARKHDPPVILAKRLKRYTSIHKKLVRFPNMSLKSMQDIGGCRAIFTTEKRLVKTVRELRLRTEFRTADGKVRSKDYIKNPKADGYRSYHLVGQFEGLNGKNRNIEIQLRTLLQHYWATALEIVDLFTGQALKSNQGDEDWEEFFSEVAGQFALMENVHMFGTLPIEQRVRRYWREVEIAKGEKRRAKIRRLAKSLKIEKKFAAFTGSVSILDRRLKQAAESSFVLLKIDTQKRQVFSQVFHPNDSEAAENAYIMAEKADAKNDDVAIALVSSASVGGIKEAYPNFFADSTEFMKHLVMILAE